ncbi:Lsr2 dimerization domain-containing protein [Humibacillus xanthopallidus]|uniref:Lsr2 dimerization domain-containing protein n=1 Tax=Humibacillus xanthopallidus TaxID=412689 RepID=UPI001153E924|nr:histone-like nucleoid-structuring protein Lsr2 [Humibacillus xanthopallidus]
MSRRSITTLIDDVGGSTATETVTFGLDGKTYEIATLTDTASTSSPPTSLAPDLRVLVRACPGGLSDGPEPQCPIQARGVSQWAKPAAAIDWIHPAAVASLIPRPRPKFQPPER